MDIEKRILNLLKANYQDGLTISTIANETKISRMTVSKYVNVLAAEKIVRICEFGRAKVVKMTDEAKKRYRNK